MRAQLLSHIQLFVTPWTVAHQAPLSMGIFQERILEWVAMTPPGDLPNPGIKPGSPALQADPLPAELPGKILLAWILGLLPLLLVFIRYPSSIAF